MGERRLWSAMGSGRMTLSKLIDRVDKSIDRGDLPRAFRTKLDSLREQTEATEAGFQELNARIKGLEARIKEREAQIKRCERMCRSSAESNASSRKRRSLKQIVHSVFAARAGDRTGEGNALLGLVSTGRLQSEDVEMGRS